MMSPGALLELARWHRRMAAMLECQAATAERLEADRQRARDHRARVKGAAREAAYLTTGPASMPGADALRQAAERWNLEPRNIEPLMMQAARQMQARDRQTRDRRIIQAAAMGATNAEIGRRFNLSPTQISRIVNRQKRRGHPAPASNTFTAHR